MIQNASTCSKTKYQPVKKTNHEVLIDDFYEKKDSKSFIDPNEKAFDFTSINNYQSIFKYRSRSSLERQRGIIDSDTKPLAGFEKFLSYAIIGFFYLMLVVLLPFSLFVCLKRVNQHERIVLYRLGRIKSPEFKPGYYIIFPLIDNYERLTVVQKEFALTNLQILNYENAIVDISIEVRYQINDVIKVANTIQDLNSSLKSVSRGVLVSLVSKRDFSKLEVEKNYLTQDFQERMNEVIKKWGASITNVVIHINSIVRDENSENEDPALKSISMVFKSLFNNSSSTSTTQPGTSNQANQATSSFPADLLTMFQGMAPFLVPSDASTSNEEASKSSNVVINMNQEENNKNSVENIYSPYKIIKLLEPLINESLIKEIQTVYEFHIKTNNQTRNQDHIEIFHLDLKNLPKGHLGQGPPLFAKTDCIIRISAEDLKELLTDNLKPFTAYMSGRIEIDGDLQDVFKLKKLIKSVTSKIKIKN